MSATRAAILLRILQAQNLPPGTKVLSTLSLEALGNSFDRLIKFNPDKFESSIITIKQGFGFVKSFGHVHVTKDVASLTRTAHNGSASLVNRHSGILSDISALYAGILAPARQNKKAQECMEFYRLKAWGMDSETKHYTIEDQNKRADAYLKANPGDAGVYMPDGTINPVLGGGMKAFVQMETNMPIRMVDCRHSSPMYRAMIDHIEYLNPGISLDLRGESLWHHITTTEDRRFDQMIASVISSKVIMYNIDGFVADSHRGVVEDGTKGSTVAVFLGKDNERIKKLTAKILNTIYFTPHKKPTITSIPVSDINVSGLQATIDKNSI